MLTMFVVAQNRLGLRDISESTVLNSQEAYLAATSVDPSARSAGVRQLISSLPSSSHLDTEQTKNLYTLTDIMLDPSQDASVLDTLYETAPEKLANALAYVQEQVKEEEKGRTLLMIVIDRLSRNIQSWGEGTKVFMIAPALELHLGFFLSPTFLSQLSSMTDSGLEQESITHFTLLEKLVFPSLLFTQASWKRTFVAWRTVFQSGIVEKSDLFRGCKEIVGAEEIEKHVESKRLVELNGKLSAKLAGESFAHRACLSYITIARD